MITPVIVANNLIKRAMKEHKDITPLKLQKLIYFLYKEYLQTTGKALFTEPFETWQYGPVVPSVYYEFSSFDKSPITKFARDSKGIVKIVVEQGKFKEAFDKVWERYSDYSGEYLSNKTHTQGSAWDKAYNGRRPYLEVEDIRNEPEL